MGKTAKAAAASGTAGSITKGQVLGYFLEAVNKMGGAPFTTLPPMNQPITGNGGLLIGGGGLIWLLALKCMNVFGDYHLVLQQGDVEKNGRTVGKFINCIISALRAHNVSVV
jgi:hypothetical protein